MTLCVLDLVQLTGGELHLAAMPPRDGELTAIGRIELAPDRILAGDVYWRGAPLAGDVELAFLRGALGIVAAGPIREPWPGRFWLRVDDGFAALRDVVQGLLQAADEDIFANEPELKDLQLCADRRPDIYPLTCGRPATSRTTARCWRPAA